jgi:pyridoxamine 5'-phosphate oxidase
MGIINEFLNSLRHEFSSQKLEITSVHPTPIAQMEKWIEEAVDAQILEPHAMVISTVDKHCQPSSRIVYLRELNEDGLVFYTNYHSRKGRDLQVNSGGSALFFYAELERQIRIEGSISPVSEEMSDLYFASRPLESKLGAWASEQSNEISNRKVLEERLEYYKNKFGDSVPRPPHWGGYLLKPNRFEFWQGRPARLHDRIVYSLISEQWVISRLAP